MYLLHSIGYKITSNEQPATNPSGPSAGMPQGGYFRRGFFGKVSLEDTEGI